MKIFGYAFEVLAGVGAASASVFTADLTTPYIGASVPVLVGSVIGAIAGIALGDPIEPRGKLFRHAFAYVVLGAAATTFVPFLMEWELTDKQLASLAVVSAAIMRKLWPAITDNLGPWLASINPFAKRK